MQCPACGHDVQPGEAFCEECGAKLIPPPPMAVPTPVVPAPPMPAPGAPPPAPAPVALPPAPIPYDAPAPVPAPVPAATPAGATSGPRLVMKEGGAAYALAPGRDILIGRTDPQDGVYPQIDLSPHDPGMYVSRRHALIHERGGQWFIRDHDSTNYTLVGRQRVPPQQDFLIEPGDEIRFGSVVATFQA